MPILAETMAAGFSGRLTGVLIEDVRSPALLAPVWMPGEGPALRELLAHCRPAFARPLAGQRP